MLASFETRILQQKNRCQYRDRLCLDSAQGTYVTIGKKSYLSFTSSDYLSLANDKRIIEAMYDGAMRYGVGSAGSIQLTGYSRAHAQLEAIIAKRVGREKAIVFNNGYQANLGVIGALAQRQDRIFQDKHNHISLLEAVKLSRSTLYRYEHGNVDSLKKLLQDSKKSSTIKANTFIITESVFSMDGSVAPLKAIADIAKEEQAFCYVDEAHSFAVMGQHGAGLVHQWQLTQTDVPLIMGTFGKACGVNGAFVAGSSLLIDMLMQFAKTLRYSISLSPAIACAVMKSLDIIEKEPWRAARLQENIAYFREQSQGLGLSMLPSNTQIQSLLVGDSGKALQLAEKLKQSGMLALALRAPSVPLHTDRLRFNICTNHTKTDMDYLMNLLIKYKQ